MEKDEIEIDLREVFMHLLGNILVIILSTIDFMCVLLYI